MQPAATGIDGVSGVKLVKGEAIGEEGPINDERFWKRKEEDVAVEEVRFYYSEWSENIS